MVRFTAASFAVLAYILPRVAGFQSYPTLSPHGSLARTSAAADRGGRAGGAAPCAWPTTLSDWHPSRSSRVSSSLSHLGSTAHPSEPAWCCSPSTASWQPRQIMTRRGDGASSSSRLKVRNDVLFWRGAAGIALSLVAVFRRSIDQGLAMLWDHLMTGSSVVARVFRTDSYEWCLAVVAFVVWMHAFYFADQAVDAAGRNGRVHPWRKYRLQDRFEADKKRRTQLAAVKGENALTFADPRPGGEAPNDGVQQPELRTKQSDWNRQAWFFELWVYVLPLLTWDLLAPRRHRRLAPFGAPTTMRLISDVTLGLLFYDFLFFCGHCLMHRVPWIFRTIHSKHHGVKEVRAGDTVRLSLVEEVLEVGFSIVALNLLSIHPLARTLYNCVITFLLTELHCGFDFPWSPQNVVPFGLSTGSRRHHYHHRNGRHYYQKFFFTFDRILGLYQKDDGTLDGDSVRPDPYIPPTWQAA